MAKKYSKDNVKKRGIKKFAIAVLIVLLLLCLVLAIYILLKKDIIIEKVDEASKFVSDDVSKNSLPIIVDNVLIGAVYDKKWVSVDQFYAKSSNKSVQKIDVYTKRGKKGTYEMSSISQGNTSTVYSAITNANITDEYFALVSSDIDVMLIPATKCTNITEDDIEYVKKALGIYRLFNTTIRITECYDVSLSQGKNGKIICATNEAGKSMGAYSTVIYVDEYGKPSIVKYNYIKNLNESDNWPIYSFKMLGDLNQDGVNEIIIQETKEFEVKYDILEYRNEKFYEVLSTVIK